MADYSFWILGESNISITGGVGLDGITQGDGSHLVGEYLTINSTNFTEMSISDDGADTSFADNDSSQRLDGAHTIDGVTYADNTQVEAEYQIVLRDDSTGIEYTVLAVNVVEGSPSYGTIEGLAFVDNVPPSGVALRVVSASEGPSNSGGGAVDESEIVPLCLCKGTNIRTLDATTKKVEHLKTGDMVLRADGSAVKLRRAFCTKIGQAQLARNPKLRPIRIVAGALGNGLPERDLLVSRQHRMLISSKIAERMFGQKEVLIPAIKLTPLPGVFVDYDVEFVEYFHLLFDEHEIILAEGAPTESLFTGAEALKAIGADARSELLSLFPQIADETKVSKSARYIPSGKHQKQLVERHAKNAKPLLM